MNYVLAFIAVLICAVLLIPLIAATRLGQWAKYRLRCCKRRNKT